MLAIDTNDNKDTVDMEIAGYVAAANRNAIRLQELTRETLEVARIESNTLKLNKELFDLVEKIEDTIADLKYSQIVNIDTNINTNKKKNIEIVFNKSHSALLINADKMRIIEVISNLITNAINANRSTDSGGIITVSIHVSTSSKNNNTNFTCYNHAKSCVIVSVKDEGSGIDPDIKPRLFTKFVSKPGSGLGLGLYISRNIIEAHGDRIWGENNIDGRGATFSFSLLLTNCCTYTDRLHY